MTPTPADIARIAALLERVWAKVPEARPTHPTSRLNTYLSYFDPAQVQGMEPIGDSWYWTYYWPGGDLKQADKKVDDFLAIALAESSFIHWLDEVQTAKQSDGGYYVSIRMYGDDAPGWWTVQPTLVEALALAVEQRAGKESNHGTR